MAGLLDKSKLKPGTWVWIVINESSLEQYRTVGMFLGFEDSPTTTPTT
jgi:hypothetical protein